MGQRRERQRGRAAAVVAAMGLSGCAIHTPPVNISRWPLSSRAMYYRDALPYRVLVASLADERPANERQGRRAPGMFLLVWNRRVGDYYTGDRLFGGEVGVQLAQQLAGYLQAANVFMEVRYVPESPRNPDTIRQVSRPHAADYVLTGELQHFFGSQHQHLSVYLLPRYFISAFGWRDSKGFPWGKTAIRVSLCDGKTGEVVWRRQFEASERLPRETDSMADAALESFAEVAEDLTAELRRIPPDSLLRERPPDGPLTSLRRAHPDRRETAS